MTAGGVFTNDMIDGYIELKLKVERLNMTTHYVEFDIILLSLRHFKRKARDKAGFFLT